MLCVHAVDDFKLGEIDHEDGGLDDIDEIQSRTREHFAEVLEHAPSLEFDPAFDESARRRVKRDLRRAEDPPVSLDRLRIRTDRDRCLDGVNRGFHFGISLGVVARARNQWRLPFCWPRRDTRMTPSIAPMEFI